MTKNLRPSLLPRLARAVALSAPFVAGGPGLVRAQPVSAVPFSGLQVEWVTTNADQVSLSAGEYSVGYAPLEGGGPEKAFLVVEGPGRKGAPLGLSECVLNKPMNSDGTYKAGFETFFADEGALGGWINPVDAPAAKNPMLQLSIELGRHPVGKYSPSDLEKIGDLARQSWGRCQPGTPTV